MLFGIGSSCRIGSSSYSFVAFWFHLAVPFLEDIFTAIPESIVKKHTVSVWMLLHQRDRVHLNEPSVLWPGAVGDADSGGSLQRFRGAAGCMAGGGKARGNPTANTHVNTPFCEHTVSM